MSTVAQEAPAAPPVSTPPKGPQGKWFEKIIREPNPMLVKELRSTFRAKLFIRLLYLSTLALGLIILTLGAMMSSGNRPPAETGQFIFQAFFTVATIIASISAPAYGATTFTSEKKAHTYESLLLTGIRQWILVRGKFIAIFS